MHEALFQSMPSQHYHILHMVIDAADCIVPHSAGMRKQHYMIYCGLIYANGIVAAGCPDTI